MQNQSSAATMGPDTLKRLLDTDEPVVVLDVRDPEEFEAWHIRQATNFPLDRLEAGELPPIPAGARAVTVCTHGFRSATARDLLRERGIAAASLDGGMVAWNGVYDVVDLAHVAGVTVKQLRRVGKGCLSYLLAARGEAIVIDPTLDVDVYTSEAAALGARIVAVLDTHAHADHVSGASRLAEATGATYHAPPEVDARPHALVTEGARIAFGGAHVTARHTPGHTPHSMTYLLEDAVAFTGDTLFVESVGRPDLGQDAATNARILWKTLADLREKVPAEALVAPGHYGDAVVPRRNSPVAKPFHELEHDLRAFAMTEDAFVAWVVANRIPQPENFLQIKKHNRGTQPVTDEEELRELEAGPNRCAVG